MQRLKAAGRLLAQRCGSIAGMDEETRERIIVACTEAAMLVHRQKSGASACRVCEAFVIGADTLMRCL
jgi:aspartate/glutamate racemase